MRHALHSYGVLWLCRYVAVQAWELLDPPSGWDTSGPVLATGFYRISNTALQLVILIDDAMAQACHSGVCQSAGSTHQSFCQPVYNAHTGTSSLV